jgi:glycosyltransferase involved in cell wall biosynthesis
MENFKIKILISSYLNGSYENRVNTLYCLTYSLLSQTYDNFEIVIHHDGPLEDKSLKSKFESIDSRVKFIETEERKNVWGFDKRYELATSDDSVDFILFTNDDNYYTPHFFSTMISTMKSQNSEFVFCNFLHNEFDYLPFDSAVEVGKIDLGCFMASLRIVKETPWTDFSRESDGLYAKNLAKKTNPVGINNILFVHN